VFDGFYTSTPSGKFLPSSAKFAGIEPLFGTGLDFRAQFSADFIMSFRKYGKKAAWHIRCYPPLGMKCNCIETEPTATVAATNIRLPMGLLGFEKMKDYLLIANPAEEPFGWLQVQGNASLAFVVINPFLIVPDYSPDIPQTDVEFLGLNDVADAMVLNIVTVHKGGQATMNLKGPIVMNRNTGIGKQVVISNGSDYSVQHPLLVAEEAV
jgi:flagellar assembly factor FliW